MAKRITVIVSEKEYEQFKKAAGLVPLSRWIKDQCISMEALRLEKWMLEKTLPEPIFTNPITPKQRMEATAVNESNKQFYHTAASDRRTCECAIPLGGFKK
jgi:hypothetical protein